MALRLLLAQTSEFETAKSRWAGVSAHRRELKDKLAGAEAALELKVNPPAENDVRSPAIEARAHEYLGSRKPSVDTLVTEIRLLREAVAEALDSYTTERALWRAAVEAEADRRGELLRPRHRAAVAKIGKAIEALSAAVEAERAVRAELGEFGGSGLPDMGSQFGTLHEYQSTLSEWNRHAIALGALS